MVSRAQFPAKLAWFLAIAAGWMNVFGFFGWARRGITHLTGAITVTGHELASSNFGAMWSALAIILAFVAGAALSAAMGREHSQFEPKQAMRALFGEALLVVVAIALLNRHEPVGEYVLVMAMGLQNGVVLRAHSSVFRTTHVTGAFTEIGLALGSFATGQQVDVVRFTAFVTLVCCYMVGAALGTLALSHFNELMLVGPLVLVTLAAALLGSRRHATNL